MATWLRLHVLASWVSLMSTVVSVSAYKLPYGAVIKVKDGDAVEAGAIVANWDPHTHPIVSEVAGRIEFAGMEDGITVKRQTDDLTGLSTIEVLDAKDRPQAGKDIRPMIKLLNADGSEVKLTGTDMPAQYLLPAKSIINLNDGADDAGRVISFARMPQEGHN